MKALHTRIKYLRCTISISELYYLKCRTLLCVNCIAKCWTTSSSVASNRHFFVLLVKTYISFYIPDCSSVLMCNLAHSGLMKRQYQTNFFLKLLHVIANRSLIIFPKFIYCHVHCSRQIKTSSILVNQNLCWH